MCRELRLEQVDLMGGSMRIARARIGRRLELDGRLPHRCGKAVRLVDGPIRGLVFVLRCIAVSFAAGVLR